MNCETHRGLARLHDLWKRSWRWAVLLGIAVAAIVLGYVGLAKYFADVGQPRSFWDICYFILYLFVVESGEVSGPVPWQLQVARFLAPIVPAWAIVKAAALLFHEQLQMLRLRMTSRHVVVCGLGRKGLQLVRDFSSRATRMVIIELNADSHVARSCRELGAIVLSGDARETALLRKARVHRAQYVVAVCGEDATNVEIAVHCHQLVQELGRRDGPLSCFVQIVDMGLCNLFRQHRIFTETTDPMEVTIFNSFENSARLLLKEHPLDRCWIAPNDPRQVHLVVIGFGQMGQSVALQAAKTACFANGRKLRVTAIDRQGAARKGQFHTHYPQFGLVCDAQIIDADVDDPAVLAEIGQWAADPASITSVVIALDDDARCLASALHVLDKTDAYETPIFVRMSEAAGLAVLLEGTAGPRGRLAPIVAFGMSSRACARKALLNEELDLLAKAIHEDFAARRKAEGRSAVDPSVQPWNRLNPDFQDSNRQQADHIPVKLRAIHCHSLSKQKDAQGKELVNSLTDDEVELLAQMEHARWNAERLLAGWTYDPGPKNMDKRTHPDLIEWDKLPEATKDYDRQAVRLIPHLLALIGRNVYRCR